MKKDQSADINEALRLADQLLGKPLSWTEPLAPERSDCPVFRFVIFRGFIRAVSQYKSLLLLLKAGQWEDALILGRSLYELDLNLSKISDEADPEAAAKRYLKFGKFLLFRLTQRQLQDRLRDAQLKSQTSVEVADCQKQLTDIAAELDRNFAEFRKPKGKWQESWSGKNIEELARDLAQATGGQDGQNDYYVFKLASLFSHNTPGSLFLELPADHETIDWNDFRARIDDAGHTGARHFLHEASVCFVDIVGMAGGCIAGYEREWFDEFALTQLDNL